jgi:hypothetical protein
VCVYVNVRCGMAWNKHQDTGWVKTNKKNAHEAEQQEPQFNPGLRP